MVRRHNTPSTTLEGWVPIMLQDGPLTAGCQCKGPSLRDARQASEADLVLAALADEPGACEALISTFTPLIGSIARTYRGSTVVQHRELMQEGVVGLLRALRRYQPELGTPFWAYASWWVRQAMQRLLSELGRPMVLSDRALRQVAQLKATERRELQRQGRQPNPEALSQATGVPRVQVDRLMAAQRAALGLDEPLRHDSHGSGATIGDLVADPTAQDAFDGISDRMEVERLPELLRVLAERERSVVAQRFGLGGCRARTLREVGDRLGVSAERVRQIEAAALGKLRAASEAMPAHP
jgi:RNA polymerase sigma factor (sigma-70 family)